MIINNKRTFYRLSAVRNQTLLFHIRNKSNKFNYNNLGGIKNEKRNHSC